MRSLIPFAGGWEAHQHRHCIWIVSPKDFIFSHAFDEVAEVLSAGFIELGGSAPVVRHPNDWAGRTPIILGGNMLSEFRDIRLPRDTIFYNLEQMSHDSWWFSPEAGYLALLKQHPVLDWSVTNLDRLHQAGVGHAKLLNLGYSSRLSRIIPASKYTIDVLFYGELNARREAVLAKLADANVRVTALVDPVFGHERDKFVAESKIVLNLHTKEANAFEEVRVFYLLANRICVVSEGDPSETDTGRYASGVAFAPYEQLADLCIALVNDPKRRKALAEAGLRLMRSQPQSELLKRCIDAG